jgi:hypothetical protein
VNTARASSHWWPPTLSPTANGVARWVMVAAVSAVLLAGCATTPPSTLESDLSTGERVTLAVELLNHNHPDKARAELKAVVAVSPTNAAAIQLMRDMDQDPVAALGQQSFDYTVRPRETLMTLAGRFLGDPLKFYLLARYNAIAAPADVTAGQVVKIPGLPRKAPPQRFASPAPVSPSDHAPPTPAPARASPVADAAGARKLRAAALENMNRGQINRAVGLLQRATQLDPGSLLIKRDLARAQRIQAAVNRK